MNYLWELWLVGSIVAGIVGNRDAELHRPSVIFVACFLWPVFISVSLAINVNQRIKE